MGRKKGGKNATTDAKSLLITDQVLNGGKTQKKVAEELGINKETVTRHVKRALANEEIMARVRRSKDRIVKMLPLADEAYLRILKYTHPDNFANALRAATSIYKTMGIISEDPVIQVNHVTPLKVEVENRVYTIGIDQTSSETR